MTARKADRILIVDDEELVAKVLEIHLEESGYQADWASSGEDCLNRIAAQPYSLVLLDIWMPRMSGVEVLEQIRKSHQDVSVIMMSGHGSESMAVTCMKTGAVDYVTKPFDLTDVLQRVEQALMNRTTLLEKQRLEREKDDFVSMLSHDMKNPLTAVIGSIDIMREGRLGPVNVEQVEYLQSAIDSCNEVVSMIDNLLDIYRFEAGHMTLAIQPCDPENILASLVTRFSLLAGREGLRLSADLDRNLPEISVDRSAFLRTMGNLLGNALKFSPEGGEITLSCHPLARETAMEMAIPAYAASQSEQMFSEHARFVLLSVRDTGNGIPLEDQERIFERFVQSQRGNKNYGGAGLGLAYCKLTVESFGGAIWVVSSPGQGSEFFILLPAVEEGVSDGE
ncbi:MAG: response regulator [Desulfuromonadales bacterium]|nr:response regulator [Desulfuromonadales bacterium]